VASVRRLSAIMFTDMVGSTASAQADEASALRVREQQQQLVRPFFAPHQGREVKSMGDGFLVEFDSALHGVQCAVEIQRMLHEHNLSVRDSAKIRLRIGIHLGDVVHEGTDVVGDSVNIASRIEALADPGGVCITEPVFGQVRNKLPNRFEKLEPKTLKNVRFSIDVYRVVLPWTAWDPAADPSGPTGIAVLPFSNISPDPKDEYFADGLTEELILVLSRLKDLRVIARTSVMQYKPTSKAVSQIGAELGVSSILEGSVRKVGSQLRVTAQLIDVSSQGHLWADTYDRELDDVFAVQRDIATKVAGSLATYLPEPKAPAPAPTETQAMPAYLSFLQGQALVWQREELPLRQALRFFEEAVRLDPSFSRAHAAMAKCYVEMGQGRFISWPEAIERGKGAVQMASSMNPDLAEAHELLAELMTMADDPLELQEKEVRKALELNPSSADAHSTLGQIEALKGDPEAYARHSELAYRLDPLSPRAIRSLGRAYFYAGREHDALEHWRKTLTLDPLTSYRGMTDYYLSTGDLEKAGALVKEMERVAPTSEYTYLNRGYLAALQGDTTTATEMIGRLVATDQGGMVGHAGYVYLALGDLDKFFECQFTAANRHSLHANDLLYSPLFVEVRKDPRFEKLLTLVGLKLPPAS
jgi:adenylate cyclase